MKYAHYAIIFLLISWHSSSLLGQVSPVNVGEPSFVSSITVNAVTVEPGSVTFADIGPGCNAGPAPLPISVPDLSARRLNPERVELSWREFQRYDGNVWVLERRFDQASDFTAIRDLSERDLQQRFWVDQNSYPSKTFYRLHGISLEGEEVYSRIRVVGNAVASDELTIFPNPFSNLATINLPPTERGGTLLIVDALGRLVSRQSVSAGPASAISLSGAQLGSGTFQVVFHETDGEVATLRFVKE